MIVPLLPISSIVAVAVVAKLIPTWRFKIRQQQS